MLQFLLRYLLMGVLVGLIFRLAFALWAFAVCLKMTKNHISYDDRKFITEPMCRSKDGAKASDKPKLCHRIRHFIYEFLAYSVITVIWPIAYTAILVMIILPTAKDVMKRFNMVITKRMEQEQV